MTRFTVALLAALPLAAAIPAAPAHVAFFKRDGGATAAELIGQIMPQTLSCAGTDPAGCASADQAAPYFIDALASNKLFSPAEIAGVLALTALESGELVYRRRKDVAGQGTSNMQTLMFNKLYAESIPALAEPLAAAGDDPNALVDLLIVDEYNFGSGAWFLATQCTDDVRKALQAGDDAGFEAYMGCVGVDMTEPRLKYWTAAKAAFGL